PLGADPEPRTRVSARQVGFRAVDGWSTVTSTGAVAFVAVVAALLAIGLLLVSAAQRRTRHELARTREMHEELLARLSLLERPAVGQAPASTTEYVITDVGSEE